MKFKKSKIVTIESPNGRLRLSWNDGSPKRRTMAIGMPNTPHGRALAKKTKGEIETDLAIGGDCYDRTLLKYRPQTLGKNATSISVPELFERFTKYKAKAKSLSPFSVSTRYKAISAKLTEHLDSWLLRLLVAYFWPLAKSYFLARFSFHYIAQLKKDKETNFSVLLVIYGYCEERLFFTKHAK